MIVLRMRPCVANGMSVVAGRFCSPLCAWPHIVADECAGGMACVVSGLHRKAHSTRVHSRCLIKMRSTDNEVNR